MDGFIASVDISSPGELGVISLSQPLYVSETLDTGDN